MTNGIKSLDIRLKPLRTWFLIAAIFFVGFSVVYTSHGPRLSDPDAWFQYKMAQYVLEDGGVPETYDLAYFPEGRRPWLQDTMVLPYLFAYTYKLVSFSGLTPMEWAMLFPAVFQGLAAVALFLAARELWDERVGLLSGLLYGFIPLALSRVYSGTIDKEVIYGAFAYGSLYFFMKGYKNGIHIDKPRSLIAPLLAGIFYGVSYANWTGGAYIALVIGAAAFLRLIFEKDLEIAKSLFAIALIGPLVMHLLQPERFGYSYFMPSFNFLLPFAVGFLPLSSILISNHLKKQGNDIHYLKVMAGVVVAAMVFLSVIGMGDVMKSFVSTPVSLLTAEKGAQGNIYMATVAESQPSHLLGSGSTTWQKIRNGNYFGELRSALFVLPVGLLLLLLRLMGGNKDFSTIFTLAWLVSGFIAADQGLRYLFFLAPSAAVVTAYTFVALYNEIKKKEGEVQHILNSTSKKRVLQRAESRLTNIRIAHLVLIVTLPAVTIGTLNAAVEYRNFQSDLPRPWYDATMWFKDNTPDDSVIFFWWDYGYYFQALSNKYTIADGGGNVMRNINLANMFTSPEDEAMQFITKYVDYEETPTYILVSYEEFGKSGAINRIAGGDPETGATLFQTDGRMEDGQLYILNFNVPGTGDPKQDEQNLANALSGNNPYGAPFSTYYITNMGNSYLVWVLVQFDQGGSYQPEWAEKLLPKLLPFNTGYGQGLKHFELVYQDQWNYILIYKIK